MSLFAKKAPAATKAGNYKTSIHSVGFTDTITNEQGEQETIYSLVKRGDYAFKLGFKFGQGFNGNDPMTTYVDLPYFKVSADPNAKGNYLNTPKYKKEGVLQVNPESVDRVEKDYVSMIQTYMVDLLSVYTTKTADKTARQVALDKVYSFSRIARIANSVNFEPTPFYKVYGYTEGDTWNGTEANNESPEEKVSAKGYTNNYGIVEGKPTYLSFLDYSGGKVFYTEIDLAKVSSHLEGQEAMDFELDYYSNGVNVWMENFLTLCLQFVKDNNRGQQGFVFRDWKKSKKGDYFLTVVNTPKSLTLSRYTAKVGNDWLVVQLEDKDQYENFKASYYGNNTGLNFKDEKGFYQTRLQFIFRAEEFNEKVEGVDPMVTYRTGGNPLLVMEKPLVVVEDEQEPDTTPDPNEDTHF